MIVNYDFFRTNSPENCFSDIRKFQSTFIPIYQKSQDKVFRIGLLVSVSWIFYLRLL